MQLREIPVERLFISALDKDFVSIAKHQRAKSIPLRLENPILTFRQFSNSLGQHRQDRRVHYKVHSSWYNAALTYGLLVNMAMKLNFRLLLFFVLSTFSVSVSAQTLTERLGYPSGTKLIIIHADDLGETHAVNAAAIKAIEGG